MSSPYFLAPYSGKKGSSKSLEPKPKDQFYIFLKSEKFIFGLLPLKNNSS